MKKIEHLLSSKEELANVRTSLEQRTEQAFNDFAKAKQKSWAMAHLKYLD